jgi:hypothetical protein
MQGQHGYTSMQLSGPVSSVCLNQLRNSSTRHNLLAGLSCAYLHRLSLSLHGVELVIELLCR